MEAGDPRFLQACRRQPVDCTPVWIMRQAGRYLPEYREIRREHTLLEICTTPELAREVALQPLRRFDLDAAILFSDLLVPVAALGCEFDIVEGRGPVIARPVRDRDDVRSLRPPGDLGQLEFVFETIRLIKGSVQVPVIGFAGAPFTMASYLIEGGATREFRETKLLMYGDPAAWTDLMRRLSDLVISYVEAQVGAGAAAIQIFDSWVGCLGPTDYRRHVLEPTRRVFQALRRLGAPAIHFSTTTSGLLPLIAEAGGDVLGVDWRVSLGEVRSAFPDRAVQGNLDPLALMAPRDAMDRMIDQVLEEAGPAPGHIFNLGHGILPDTPVDSVDHLVRAVHERTRRT